jgi:UPF0755 protein
VVETDDGFVMSVQFNDQGKWLLEQYTTANSKRRLAIRTQFRQTTNVFDRWIAAPRIARGITNGILTFTPDASQDEADTIVEGWNIRQLRAALNAATPLLHETRQLDDAALMKLLGHPGQHPEGRFLPETYVYSRGDSDVDVLKRAYDAMDKALAEVWKARADDLPLKSAEEALILASIIEKETGLASERRQIAGVFARRLKLGLKLQTDPTVIYGIGSSYDGNIRRRDLLTDTPYNTYPRTGLTPTPIAMPGLDALRAAVDPAPGDALFFVALGDGSGSHIFTATLGEHNAAVARYLQQLRRPPLPEEEPLQ